MNPIKKRKLAGNQRRIKNAMEKASKNCHSLLNMFTASTEESRQSRIENQEQEIEEILEISEITETEESRQSSIENPVEQDQEIEDNEDNMEVVREESEEFVLEFPKQLFNSDVDWPTDPYLFGNKPLTTNLVEKILKHGPCQPGIKDNEYFTFKNNFNRRYYFYDNPDTKKRLTRSWLIYSPRSLKCYCFCCWLFANKKSKYYNVKWSDVNIGGFDNFRKTFEKIKQHENTNIHKQAFKTMCMTRLRFTNCSTVTNLMQQNEMNRIATNRRIVTELLDYVLFLARQSLPLRGHREYGGKATKGENEGNFLELVKFMSKRNNDIANHLLKCNRNETYLSEKIQNDFIKALGQETLSKIIDEVKCARYYSIIVDSTIDISRQDQFSLSLRYVNIKGIVMERFIKFDILKHSAAENFFNLVVASLNNLGLDIKNCRGQAYDGASTMSGSFSGLQKRIKDLEPSAIFVHCCAHNLNLLLCDGASSCVEAKTFFGIVESIYVFINGSLPRLNILEEEQNLCDNMSRFLTLKRLSETRWYSRLSSVIAVKENITAIHRTVTRCVEGELVLTHKAISEGRGILSYIDTFEFYIMLVMWIEILEKINILSKFLQTKSINLKTANTLISACHNSIVSLRSEDHFREIIDHAKDICKLCDVEPVFKTTRKKKVKKFHDELCEDNPIENRMKWFQVNIYYVIIDTIIQKFTNRFKDFQATARMFDILNPVNFNNVSCDTISNYEKECIKILVNFYKNDISCEMDVLKEFKSFKSFLVEFFHSDKKINENEIKNDEMVTFILANQLNEIYPNILILFKIYLTIPISSASAERSFSRLKIIKNYLRNKTGEERLSFLSILSIERDVSNDLDLDKVLNLFSSMKSRRKQL